jgi:hypothetical protein
MKDKHFITALALLVLPLSFGGGSAAGTKAAAEMDASHREFRKQHRYVAHGFTVAEMAALVAGSPIGSGDASKPNELFVSSLDANRYTPCGGTANVAADAKLGKLNGDCFALSSGAVNAKTSASGFPMYDSFRGSETSQYSHAGGNSGVIGGGSGGGPGSGSAGPIPNDPANPNAPISAPEPGTLMMLASGLLILGTFARRRMRTANVSAN